MRLNAAQRAWVLYDMGNASYALIVRTVFAALLFKYCADGVWDPAVTTARWGYVCSIAGIAAGAVSILLGALADARNCRKLLLGIFVAAGTLSTAAFALLQKGMVGYVLALSFISLGCYMSANSFYDSLLLSVCSKSLRDRLSTLAYALGYVGGVIPFILCLVLSALMTDKVAAMRGAFIIAALWWLILSLPLFAVVRERRRARGAEPPASFIDNCRELAKNRNVLLFLGAYFLYIDGVGTIYTMAAPIAVDTGISTPLLLGVILGLQFLAFPCTLFYGRLSRVFHPRTLVLGAIGVYILISLLALLMSFSAFAPHRPGIFILLAVLIGTSQGGIQSLSRSLFSRIVPPRQASEFFGFYNLFGKFTTIVGPVLVGIAAAATGKATTGIAMLAVPFALGGFLLTRVDFSGKELSRGA